VQVGSYEHPSGVPIFLGDDGGRLFKSDDFGFFADIYYIPFSNMHAGCNSLILEYKNLLPTYRLLHPVPVVLERAAICWPEDVAP